MAWRPSPLAVEGLAARDLDGLPRPGAGRAGLALRRLLDRLEGQWLRELAGVDGRGAAGADQGVPALSTASWLRTRLHRSASSAASSVRTARALFHRPLETTAMALTGGELSAPHARVLAHGTHDLPEEVTVEAEPVLVEAARRLDPGRLRRVALAVRDGGCVFPDCQRPLAWCEAYHLRHWLHGGPTDLANLVRLCRAHHRAVHEGGWRLRRGRDGRLTATPPHRPHGRHHRHRAAA
jgi:Domain of unknown function (DUF222)